MTTRRKVILTSVAATVWPASVIAQGKVPVVGLLWLEPSPFRKQLFDALRERGYIENQNIRLLDRTTTAGYGQLANNARELVSAKVDVIVAYGSTAAEAASKATREIPVIVLAGNDPVKAGWAVSLSHPRGNVTGVTSLNSSALAAKRLELLKDMLPGLVRVGHLVAADSANTANAKRDMVEATRHFGMTFHTPDVHKPAELERAFDEMARARVGAIVVGSNTMFLGQVERIVALAAKFRLPAVYGTRVFTESGGLISYSPDFGETVRRLVHHVDRVLKGARPADLPIEQPTKFELVVNLKTAKALGITPPPTVMVRASRVIE